MVLRREGTMMGGRCVVFDLCINVLLCVFVRKDMPRDSSSVVRETV